MEANPRPTEAGEEPGIRHRWIQAQLTSTKLTDALLTWDATAA